MLYFVLGALSYILNWPELNTDPITKTIGAICYSLVITHLAELNILPRLRKSVFSQGILLPALILVFLAISYLASGSPLAIEISTETFIPDFTKIGTLVVFVAFILSYMGVEASATHVNEMKTPVEITRSDVFTMIAAICLSSIGGLSVAAVIPNSEINLSAGVVQTFNVLITHFNSSLEWAVRIIAALLLLGVLAEIA